MLTQSNSQFLDDYEVVNAAIEEVNSIRVREGPQTENRRLKRLYVNARFAMQRIVEFNLVLAEERKLQQKLRRDEL